MEIISVEMIDYRDSHLKYHGNIVVSKDGSAVYALDGDWYTIPQRLLDEIIFLRNLDPVNNSPEEEDEQQEMALGVTLSMKDLAQLAANFSGEEICELRRFGLI